MSDKPKKNDAILITTNHIKGYEKKNCIPIITLKRIQVTVLNKWY